MAFQSPEVSKFKTKTMLSDDFSNEKIKEILEGTAQKYEHSSGKRLDTDEGDFDREVTFEIQQKFNIESTAKRSEFSSMRDSPRNQHLISNEESSKLKAWIKFLSNKVRSIQKQNERMVFDKNRECEMLERKLSEANSKIDELRSQNKNLNKQLIQAVVAIKMSWFSFELNNNDQDTLVYQLQHENESLREMLNLRTKYFNKQEIEDILRSEESLSRNKEAFLRSRSLQFKSNNSSIMYNVKREEIIHKKKGKKSDGNKTKIKFILDTRGLIRDSIRKNKKRSKRKRSESFDYSMFIAPSRLDTSDSDSDFSDEEDDSYHPKNDSRRTLKSNWSQDVQEIKEEQDEYSSSFKKNNTFGFGGGFKMQTAPEPEKDDNTEKDDKTEKDKNSPGFIKGYKMQTK